MKDLENHASDPAQTNSQAVVQQLPRRVLVCGGRNFDQWRTVARELDATMPIGLLIQGGAQGADALAVKWAESRDVPVMTFRPNWRLGKKAGPIRNQLMLDEGKPDLVVAFPGGRGTEDMMMRANAANVSVVIIPSSLRRAQQPDDPV